MPLNDLSTNTTQPAGQHPAGQQPAPQPGANWQHPVFSAPGLHSAPSNATAGRIPGIVRSRRPRWTPEKHARILARIKASRTDLMPPLPEVVEEALEGATEAAHPAVVDHSWTAAIGQLAETTRSCFYGLTEGALDLLQRSLPAGGSWPLPGAAAAQTADAGDTLQSRADAADPTCAAKPGDTPQTASRPLDLNQFKAAWGQDFDIRVSPALAKRADPSLTNVLIVIGDANHYDDGMNQLIDAVLSATSTRGDVLFAEAPPGCSPSDIRCRKIEGLQCIGIDNPAVVVPMQNAQQGFFGATREAIRLIRNEIPAAQQDRLVPLLPPHASYMEASGRLNTIIQLLTKGTVKVAVERSPALKTQLDLAKKFETSLLSVIKDPKQFKARDDHMRTQLENAIEDDLLEGKRGFAVIGQSHLSNIRDRLLKELPCIVLEQKKFKNLPPLTWQPGQRITY